MFAKKLSGEIPLLTTTQPIGFYEKKSIYYLTYPERNAQQLHEALRLLKASRCLNISAFCRQAIDKKLKRLEALK
jgi:hypothetical protein